MSVKSDKFFEIIESDMFIDENDMDIQNADVYIELRDHVDALTLCLQELVDGSILDSKPTELTLATARELLS